MSHKPLTAEHKLKISLAKRKRDAENKEFKLKDVPVVPSMFDPFVIDSPIIPAAPMMQRRREPISSDTVDVVCRTILEVLQELPPLIPDPTKRRSIIKMLNFAIRLLEER